MHRILTAALSAPLVMLTMAMPIGLVGTTPAHAQVSSQRDCPRGSTWCGPGRGCCPQGETCAPVSGCAGGVRTGVACGTGHCRPGFTCITDKDGVQRCQE